MFMFAAALSFGPLAPHARAQCLGDVFPDGSGSVDSWDLAIILSSWGVETTVGELFSAADIDHDRIVGAADLAFVISGWGACPGTIISVSPLEGSILGGTQIEVNGTYLGGTTTVQIGGVDCTNLQVLSQILVKAVTPAGVDGGKVSIALISQAGSLMSPTPFTYIQLSISSVSPAQGIYSGGTAITITGAFLNGATSVKVGGVPATNVVVVNSTTVTAVTPAGSVGPVSVEVTGLNGTATESGAFTYISVTVPSWATLLDALPDPAVVTNADLRAAITATGLAWRVRHTVSNIEMLQIPPGAFEMGCSASADGPCSNDERPVHHVILTNAFYLGRYEVTQAQWSAAMGNNPSSFQAPAYPGSMDRPVENVDGLGVILSFCTPNGLSLPTEAEWEYAYRAGTTTAFHNGTSDDTLLENIAWYVGNNGASGSPTYGTKALGGKSANALGLHDMSGNVWEECQDWYGPYPTESVSNPTGPPEGVWKVLRGGSWGSASIDCRASKRHTPVAGCLNCGDHNGFRVARNP